MNRIAFILLVALVSCTPKVIEKTTKVYPGGQPESIMYFNEGDSNPFAQKVFYSDGKMKIEGSFENGKRQGVWTSYYQNGQIWTINVYDQDTNHGEYIMYNSDGTVKLKGQYDHGEETGTWIINDERGNFIQEKTFN
ncbi:MAG: hypothetical protein KDC12_07890 [Flavobacteriales bacterium]|nr:hypothetical protein [Flavobacteriales bacterium]